LASAVPETVLAEIQAADAVIAVISEETSNVFFEIGMAVGLRKPVLALLSPGITVPAFGSSFNYLTTDLADSEVLRLAVKRFLHKPRERHKKRRKKRRKKQLIRKSDSQIPGTPVHAIIEQLSVLRQSGDGYALERTVAELLRAAGVSTVEQYKGAADRGVDFAVWSDELRSSLGSPILIEVKSSKLDEMSFQIAYSRLAKLVQESGSAAGLFLYLDKGGRRFQKPANWIPSVLWFDLEDFAKRLSRKSFATVLVEHRNRIVHGLAD